MSLIKPLVVLTGPTGTGKSAIAVQVATPLDAEIVCADSRQIYGGFPIGSAQPTAEERMAVPHHLFEVLEPDQACSAGAYRNMAREAIHEVASRGKLPMLVGGSGLYVGAVLGQVTLAPPVNPDIQAHFLERASSEGCEPLWRELVHVDPAASRRIHRHDTYRVVRALSVYAATGRRVTDWQGREAPEYVPLIQIALSMPRQDLYQRIDERCERMFAGGVIEEARALRARGLPPSLPALKAIGYPTLCRVLDGSISRQEALALIQRDSRRYAKRQLTWWRGRPGLHWIDARNRKEAAGCMLEQVTRALQKTSQRAGAL